MTVPPSAAESTGLRSGLPGIVRVYGSPRFHADGDLLALAFAADDTLWSVEDPGVLRQWDPSSGQYLQQHKLSDLETLWVFSSQAQLLASACDDLTLWDVPAGKVLMGITQPSWVTGMAFSQDEGRIATGHDDHVVRIWDVASGCLVREFAGHHSPISALAFSHDGARLASAGEDRQIHLWDVANGRLLRTSSGHTDRIPALTWHPQGQFLVSAGWDTTARVWDAATGQPLILLNSHAEQVLTLAFSPDGRTLACADSAHAIHLWDTNTWKTLRVLKVHTDEIRSLAFSRERPPAAQGHSQLLASGGLDRTIHVWDQRGGELLSNPDNPARHTISVAPSRHGLRLASTCGGSALRLWDTATGQALLQAQAGGAGWHGVACSPDGNWVATGGTERVSQLWHAANGALHLPLEGQKGPIAHLAFSPDSTTVATASASDGTVWLWQTASGQPILLIPEAADGCSVESLAFHPDGRLLACGGIDWMATGGTDGAICLWDLVQPARVALFDRGTRCLAFHPTGRWLAAASLEESIYLWDVQQGQLAAELPGHKEGVNCLIYSPDGRWLVSGSDDRTVCIWDVASGALLAQRELDTPVKTLCFSPDGRMLFTGNGNTTCYQLDVQRLLS